MKHIDVQNLQYQLGALINYCVEKKVTNLHLNYGLKKNVTIVDNAIKEIRDGISTELIDLETKIVELGKAENDKKKEEGVEFPNFLQALDVNLKTGLTLASEEDAARYDVLIKEYRAFLEEESDIQLYKIDMDKLDGVELEFNYVEILDKFLK